MREEKKLAYELGNNRIEITEYRIDFRYIDIKKKQGIDTHIS